MDNIAPSRDGLNSNGHNRHPGSYVPKDIKPKRQRRTKSARPAEEVGCDVWRERIMMARAMQRDCPTKEIAANGPADVMDLHNGRVMS